MSKKTIRTISYQARVEALYKERPFLHDCFDMSQVTSVKVYLVYRNLLKWDPRPKPMALLDQAGNILSWVNRTETIIEGDPNKRWWQFLKRRKDRIKVCYHSQTVGEALNQLGPQAEEVVFIVHYDNGDLKLYRPPRGFTLLSWLRQEVESAREMLKKEDRAIDEEAGVL